MGYYSHIRDFEQFEFPLILGATRETVLQRVIDSGTDGKWLAQELEDWFEISVEDQQLILEPSDDQSKAYLLPQALDRLIKVTRDLQEDADLGDPTVLNGLRIKFELWGEESGDVTLLKSDGEQLLGIEGEMTFTKEAVPYNELFRGI